MAKLMRVFQTRPSALRLHRELTICLASGDAARSADLASTLADAVRECTAAAKDSAAPPPAPSAEDIAESVEIARRGLFSRDAAGAADALLDCPTEQSKGPVVSEGHGPAAHSATAGGARPFWDRPEALRVTLLESTFETTLPPGAGDDPLTDAGARAEGQERERLALLDAYLSREAQRWAAQKAAAAHAVLATARRAGLTPSALHAAAGPGDGQLRVLRHCNVVVRGEAPDAAEGLAGSADALVDAELEVLAKRMADSGTPLSPRDREMARCELLLTKSRVRYLVGVHRELQAALDAERPGGAEAFVQDAVAVLNGDESDTAEGAAERRDVLVTPVLPFTFMLKMCLWFELPRGDDKKMQE